MRFLISILALVGFGTAASAQNLGVQFDKMPIGTKMYYKDYEGDRWTDEFKGRKGKFYLLKREYEGRAYSSKVYYTLDGHLNRISFVGGGKISYLPHDCRHVVGECQYRYRGRWEWNGMYDAKLTRISGNRYGYSWTEVSNEETKDSIILFGPYNLIKERSWKTVGGKKRFVRLLKVE